MAGPLAITHRWLDAAHFSKELIQVPDLPATKARTHKISRKKEKITNKRIYNGKGISRYIV
jgi:hypothetical protein